MGRRRMLLLVICLSIGSLLALLSETALAQRPSTSPAPASKPKPPATSLAPAKPKPPANSLVPAKPKPPTTSLGPTNPKPPSTTKPVPSKPVVTKPPVQPKPEVTKPGTGKGNSTIANPGSGKGSGKVTPGKGSGTGTGSGKVTGPSNGSGSGRKGGSGKGKGKNPPKGSGSAAPDKSIGSGTGTGEGAGQKIGRSDGGIADSGKIALPGTTSNQTTNKTTTAPPAPPPPPPSPPPPPPLTPAQRAALVVVDDIIATLTDARYTGFAQGVRLTGLNTTLMNTLAAGVNVTLFAPTNGAYNRLPNNTRFWSLRKKLDAFRQIMAYHVVPRRMDANELKALANGSTMLTLNNRLSLKKNMTDAYYVRMGKLSDPVGARVVSPNLVVRQHYVIHGVDTVMLPGKMRANGTWSGMSLAE